MKKIICVLLALSLLVGMCACAPTDSDSFRLWFVAEGEHGSPVLRTEPYEGKKTVPDVIRALLDGPSDAGLTSPVPNGVFLNSWSQSGTAVHLDLSGPYDELSGMELTLADYCITLSLTQLPSVTSVSISVDGSLMLRRGKQTMRAQDVVLSGVEEEPVELTAALYFRRAGGNELGAELRMFRLIESESATLAVLQALLAGPEEAGLVAVLPPDLTVYSAKVEGGVCYADLSSVFLDEMPENGAMQMLVVRSIAESLCSLGYVQAVQLLVEGEPLEKYGVVDVSQPFH